MAMDISPYIFFSGGKCREAFTYYKEVLGGDLMLITGAEMSSDDEVTPEMADMIMHASLRTDGQTLFGSDDPTGDGGPKLGQMVSLSNDPDSVKQAFEALSDGGTVTMPLSPTSWALLFGMCVDRWGTPWMFNAEPDED